MPAYSAPATPAVDPNNIAPSPPSSKWSTKSTTSLPSATASSWRSASKRSPEATQLPFVENRGLFAHTQLELEKILFPSLMERVPELLAEKDIDCVDALELNWACRTWHPYCPAILIAALSDWIPDIRHVNVHRYKITALAAIKSMLEAAFFANHMGYEDLGRMLEAIAREMDWCRVQMEKANISLPKDLPEELKRTIGGRLNGVLRTSQKGATWEVSDGWEISAEVHAYTFEQKLEENSWADPKKWGQDRNRNYQDTSSSRSRSPPLRRASVIEKVDSWRSGSGCVSSTSPTSGNSVPFGAPKPSAQHKATPAPAKLSPGGDEGELWRSSKPGSLAFNSREAPTVQNTSELPPPLPPSSAEKVDRWKFSTSACGNASSSISTPSKSVPTYVPPAKRGGSGSSWARKNPEVLASRQFSLECEAVVLASNSIST